MKTFSIELFSNMYKVYMNHEFIGYTLTWADAEALIAKLSKGGSK